VGGHVTGGAVDPDNGVGMAGLEAPGLSAPAASGNSDKGEDAPALGAPAAATMEAAAAPAAAVAPGPDARGARASSERVPASRHGGEGGEVEEVADGCWMLPDGGTAAGTAAKLAGLTLSGGGGGGELSVSNTVSSGPVAALAKGGGIVATGAVNGVGRSAWHVPLGASAPPAVAVVG